MSGNYNVIFRGKYIRGTLLFKEDKVCIKTAKEEILLSKENVARVNFDRIQEADNAIRDYMKSTYGMPTRLTDREIGNKRYFEVKIKYLGMGSGISFVNMLYDDADKLRKILRNQGIKVYGF